MTPEKFVPPVSHMTAHIRYGEVTVQRLGKVFNPLKDVFTRGGYVMFFFATFSSVPVQWGGLVEIMEEVSTTMTCG